MRQRTAPHRDITGHRIMTVEVEGQGPYHFRFPSFSAAARYVGLLQSAGDAENSTARLSGILDVAGYVTGACWHHPTMDLDSGGAPTIDPEGAWHSYGDMVIDELQESGWSLSQVMALSNGLVAEFTARLSEVTEAQDEGNV